MNIEIANRLYELRKKNGLSQEELAEKIGVSRQAVSKWERAESSPDTDNLIELARLYGVSLDGLLFTTEPVERKSAEQSMRTQEDISQLVGAATEMRGLRTLGALFVPLVITGAYLLMGFLLGTWHPNWIVFLAIPIYFQLVSMFAAKGLRKKLNRFPMALLCVVAYLLLGFSPLRLWHPGWVLFLIIPIYHSVASTVFRN